MPDLYHQIGADLALSPSGDLQLADGAELTRQRVLRRLLTNPADYLWHLRYGAGLPGMVGTPAVPQRIAAVIRSQMKAERTVARDPAPVAEVTARSDGSVTASVRYGDVAAPGPQLLTFAVG